MEENVREPDFMMQNLHIFPLYVFQNIILKELASLLVAQLSERWCTSLGAQGSIPCMTRSESAITRGKTQMMLLPPNISSFYLGLNMFLFFNQRKPHKQVWFG
jgi:hypothetical protein